MASRRPRSPVLLVEDNPDVREAMEALLAIEGYTVVSAADGEEALEVLRGGLVPCLILLDMLMPRKDGLQFRAEQLDDPTFASIPTIAYSADSALERNAKALGLPFVKKPVLIGTMLDIVERHCLPS